MKELFNFIKNAMLTRMVTGTPPKPIIKHVEMWRGQTTRERIQKTENPYRTPAVFMEFLVEETRNLSLGIKDISLRVRFRFALHHMKFERFEDLDFQTDFDRFIQGLRGNATDPVQFGTLQENVDMKDEDYDMINEPFLDYLTVWRKNSAYKQATDIVFAPVTPVVTGTKLTP